MPIQPGRLLTEEEANDVKASLAIDGLTRISFAEKHSVSAQRVTKMIGRSETVTAKYAKLFNRQLRVLLNRVSALAA